MKETFCKIIELPEHQVLVQQDYNDEEYPTAPYGLAQTTMMEGMSLKVTASFKDEDKRNEAFKTYDLSQAVKFVEGLINWLKDNEDPELDTVINVDKE